MNVFKSGICPVKATKDKWPKVLTPKHTSKTSNSSCTSKIR